MSFGPHIDPGFSNSIEIAVFAAVGLWCGYQVKRLGDAILALAYRASRPQPSAAATMVSQELSSPPVVHIPSSILPWETPAPDDE